MNMSLSHFPMMLDELQSYPDQPSSVPSWSPEKSAERSSTMTLALASQVFLWALGCAGSGRDSQPLGSETEGPSPKRFFIFRGTVHFRLLITHWICVAHQSVGVYVSPHHRSEHGAAHQALSQGMYLQSGCLLLACLGLRSESCWPASTHKGLPVIIFCLGKWLPLSQVIYLFLPSECFSFSSGQESERKLFHFSHQKSWPVFPGGREQPAF